MRYRRTGYVQAIQYLPDRGDLVEEILKLGAGEITSRQQTGELEIKLGNGGSLPIHPGDYVVRSPHGLYKMEAKTFRKLFEPWEETP